MSNGSQSRNSVVKLLSIGLLGYVCCGLLATVLSVAIRTGMGEGYDLFAYPLALFAAGWFAGWYGAEYASAKIVVVVIAGVFIVLTTLLFVLPVYEPHVLGVEKLLVLALSLIGPLLGVRRHQIQFQAQNW